MAPIVKKIRCSRHHSKPTIKDRCKNTNCGFNQDCNQKYKSARIQPNTAEHVQRRGTHFLSLPLGPIKSHSQLMFAKPKPSSRPTNTICINISSTTQKIRTTEGSSERLPVTDFTTCSVANTTCINIRRTTRKDSYYPKALVKGYRWNISLPVPYQTHFVWISFVQHKWFVVPEGVGKRVPLKLFNTRTVTTNHSNIFTLIIAMNHCRPKATVHSTEAKLVVGFVWRKKMNANAKRIPSSSHKKLIWTTTKHTNQQPNYDCHQICSSFLCRRR